MEIDNKKVDEITLALLYLTTFKDKYGLRAWKSHSWDVLDRLHESGQIYDPATKAKSVMLTEEGAERFEAPVREALHEGLASTRGANGGLGASELECNGLLTSIIGNNS